MKPFLFVFLSFCPLVEAATVHAFWSAQSLQNPVTGTLGDYTDTVTATTFPGPTPTLVREAASSVNAGGASTFTAYDDTVWTGSGGAGSPGFSFGFNPGSARDNTLTLGFSMTNLENLSIRMDIRSGVAGSATRVLAFSSIEYSIGGGSFVTAASGTSLNFFTGSPSSNFVSWNLDLSGLSAIEDQSDVRIRFTLPTLLADTSVRLDNVQISAEVIPEPASAALAALGSACLCLRRRRA